MKAPIGLLPTTCLCALLVAACGTAPNPKPSTHVPPQAARAANPASLNCIQNGGKLEIYRMPNGDERADCILRDGKRCDEWEMFRGNCPTRTVNAGLQKFGL